MAQQHWDARYDEGLAPWDTGWPEEHLVDLVAQGRPCPLPPPRDGERRRALEIGCGTGTNALWLADQGFDVFACDVSQTAIERARTRVGARAGVRFERLDFLTDPLPDQRFELVFDRGVLHVFDLADDRARFARRVAPLLTPGGLWACLAGSTEGPPRDHGPPRRSARDLVLAIEPELEIVKLRAVMFTANIPSPAAAWWCVARRRGVPAQPSTLRDEPASRGTGVGG